MNSKFIGESIRIWRARTTVLLCAGCALAMALFLCGCAASPSVSSTDGPLEASDALMQQDGTAASSESAHAPVLDASELAEGGYAAGMASALVTDEEVDAMIAMQRSVFEVLDDAEWEAWCAQRGKTVQEYRLSVADEMLRRAFVQAEASARGVAVDDAVFEQRFEELVESYGQEPFAQALVEIGFTQDAYREVYRAVLDEEALRDALFPRASFEGTQDEQCAAQLNAFERWYADAYEEQAVVVS